MNKFNSEFWRGVATIISYIIIAISFLEKVVLNDFYILAISVGIILIMLCLIIMFYKEFKKR